MAGRSVLCRICLSVDVRMYSIVGTPLQFVYETLLNTSLNTADGRPVTVCYVCHSQLKRCYKLRVTAAKAENLLTSILEKYPGATELASLLGTQAKGLRAPLITIPVEFTDTTAFNAPIVVKQDPESTVVVKLEIEVTEDCVQPKEENSTNIGDVKDNIPLKTPRSPKQNAVTESTKEGIRKDDNPEKQHKPAPPPAESPHQCSACHRSFSQKSSLTRHLKIHTREKTYACNICTQRFTFNCTLRRHLRTHTGEKPFACTQCDRRFTQSTNLQTHLRTHTGEKPYECTHCPRRFNEKNTLRIHVRTHTGEKPFQCKICQKPFTHRTNMRQHLKSHSGETPFECDTCQQRFSRKSHLQRHFRLHTGEKPFECHICKHRFNQKNTMLIHVRTHTGEKPHECELCHRRFNKKDTLIGHLKVHSGEKPFGCDVCKRRFRDKRALQTHTRWHNGGMLQCDVCQKRFNHKRSVLRHLWTRHADRFGTLSSSVH